MDKRGVAAIAILPSGSISGHFVDAHSSQCFGLFGTQIACERECSRGEDYKLISLSILDFNSRKEVQVIVESHGQDAARFSDAIDIHGWEEDVMNALQRKDQGVCIPSVKFECEILKADKDAEHHIQKYLPSLGGRGAIVNIGTMEIKGLKFETAKGEEEIGNEGRTALNAEFEAENDHEAGNCRGDEDLERDSQNVVANDVPTSISICGDCGPPCSGCISSSKEFAEILQEELELEGLSEHKYREPALNGWREKRVLPQGSHDSF